jgi:hypothetical protein
MTDQELIRKLWDYGHFFNAKYPECQTVSESDLPNLSITDPRVVKAIESFKTFMLPSGMETAAVDAKELAAEPRCSCPDFLPPTAAVGSGGWPQPCQKGGVKVHFNTSGMPSSVVARWDEIKKKVFAAYAEIGLKLIEVATASEANIYQTWQVLAGSTIGLAEFNNETCSDRVFCKLDPGYTGYVASLLAHEIGHNCNLNHRSQGGIMHPSIQPDPNPFTWRGDPSEGDLRRMYGGEPIEPEVPPPTAPPAVIAEFTISVPGTYQLVRKGTGKPPIEV